MPKQTRNICKNGKQTSLLVQGARNAKQKSQTTVDTSKLSANNKVCIAHLTSEWHKLRYMCLRQTNQTIQTKNVSTYGKN